MVCAHHVRADQVHIGSVASSTRSLQVSTPAGQAGPSASQIGEDVAALESPTLVAGSSGMRAVHARQRSQSMRHPAFWHEPRTLCRWAGKKTQDQKAPGTRDAAPHRKRRQKACQ